LNNSELKLKALHWHSQGLRIVRVMIVKAQGSTPRPRGTFMLLTQGDCVGTIGGGHLEFEAIAIARGYCREEQGAARHDATGVGDSLLLTKHFSLGPSLGQCCGGAVDLQFEVLTPALLAAWPADSLRFTLALFGAGHVGRALVEALTLLPCQIIWIDEREGEFKGLFSSKTNAEVRIVDAPSAEIKTLPSACFVVITTHSHDLDLEICEAALRRTDLGFIGLIGSATKKARFINRLEQRKVPALERLVCPIGLDTIDGKEPAVIAASVAAQLLALSSCPVKSERYV
jgi:xanthine dehydrogenase accessory factor